MDGAGWIVQKTHRQKLEDLVEKAELDAQSSSKPSQSSASPASSSSSSSPSSSSADGITVESYSEKALVVRGDTRPIKAKLKGLKGKWNKYLKGGAGWVIGKSKEAELKAIVGVDCWKVEGGGKRKAAADDEEKEPSTKKPRKSF